MLSTDLNYQLHPLIRRTPERSPNLLVNTASGLLQFSLFASELQIVHLPVPRYSFVSDGQLQVDKRFRVVLLKHLRQCFDFFCSVDTTVERSGNPQVMSNGGNDFRLHYVCTIRYKCWKAVQIPSNLAVFQISGQMLLHLIESPIQVLR